MRPLFAVLLLLSACATISPVQPLPCTDDDAPRCVAFVELVREVRERTGPAARGLERHCLAGSLSSCQALASLRGDRSLVTLCEEGLPDACPLPAAQPGGEGLEAECVRRVPGACHRLVQHSTAAVARLPVETLEWGCTEGSALFCHHLALGLKEKAPERARSLSWRACLAGVRDACLESGEGERRCERGSDAACRAFRVAREDPPALRARKLSVLKAACRAGAETVCGELKRDELVPDEELLALACGKAGPCWAVLEKSSLRVLVSECASSTGLRRDLSCQGGLEAYAAKRFEEPALPAPVAAWAQLHCPAVPASDEEKNSCFIWGRALLAVGSFLEGTRVVCRAGDCPQKADLVFVERCLAGSKGEPCARASAWLESSAGELGSADALTAVEVMRRACDQGELSACTAGPTLLAHDPVARLGFHRKACRLGSKRACVEKEGLEAMQELCARGQCTGWARTFLEEDGYTIGPPGVAVLEKSCAAGHAEDCRSWRNELRGSPGPLFRKCAEAGKGFCPERLQQPITVAFKGCEQGEAASCADLLDLATQHIGGSSPELVDWASRACQGDLARACLRLARLLKSEEERAAPLERACRLDLGQACGELADLLWEHRPEMKAEEVSAAPSLIRARALAIRACDLEHGDGCRTASAFFESGVGGPADHLEAVRFEQRARDLGR